MTPTPPHRSFGRDVADLSMTSPHCTITHVFSARSRTVEALWKTAPVFSITSPVHPSFFNDVVRCKWGDGIGGLNSGGRGCNCQSHLVGYHSGPVESRQIGGAPPSLFASQRGKLNQPRVRHRSSRAVASQAQARRCFSITILPTPPANSDHLIVTVDGASIFTRITAPT